MLPLADSALGHRAGLPTPNRPLPSSVSESLVSSLSKSLDRRSERVSVGEEVRGPQVAVARFSSAGRRNQACGMW